MDKPCWTDPHRSCKINFPLWNEEFPFMKGNKILKSENKV